MTLADIATILGIAVPIAGIFIWAMRSTVSPLQVVIKNNTEAMGRVMDKLDCHDETLGDHSVRIAKIETVHEIQG